MKKQIMRVHKCHCARMDKHLYIYSFREAMRMFDAIAISAKGVYHNRSSYMDFVAKNCIQDYDKDVQPYVVSLIHKNKYTEIAKLKENLYALCVGLSPAIAIEKYHPKVETAVLNIRQNGQGKKSVIYKPKDDSEQILDLEMKLKQHLIGQDDAVVKIVQALTRSVAGLKHPHKPIASFMFLGNTGIGKTEMAKILSLKHFGSESNLVRIDCSEFEAKHAYSKLIGAPPGYLGYDEEPFLSKALREKPNCVLLFDEIEKANESMHKLILQVLDEGKINDGRGKEVIFNKAIIIMTSNVGSYELMKYQGRIGFDKKNDEVGIGSICLSALQKKFSPEFINRISEIVVFKPLERESLLRIFDVLLDEYVSFLAKKNIDVAVHNSAAEFIVDQSSYKQYGARELQRVMERHIINPLADMIVNKKVFPGDEVEIFCQDEKIAFEIQKCEDRMITLIHKE